MSVLHSRIVNEDYLSTPGHHPDPGGEIMIHGLPADLAWVGSLHRMFDWTRGCVAVTDAEIDEIWMVVPNGTTIQIRP